MAQVFSFIESQCSLLHRALRFEHLDARLGGFHLRFLLEVIGQQRQCIAGFDRIGFFEKKLLHTRTFRSGVMRNFNHPRTRLDSTQRTDTLFSIEQAAVFRQRVEAG